MSTVFCPSALQGIDDASDLLRRFARAVDDLGRALPQAAVMVDARIAEVLKRSLAQLQGRVRDGNASVAHLREQVGADEFTAWRASKSSRTAR